VKGSKLQIRQRLTGLDPLIVMGASTGGTEALRIVLESLPQEIPPILIVQHIPASFSKAFADRMDTLVSFNVREAADGDEVRSNTVLIAPGGQQMKLESSGDGWRVRINDDAPVNRHKPSVDYLFESVQRLGLKNVVAVLLTGMGKDGAIGLKKLRDGGGRTIAQDEESSVVFGMPREAIRIGAAERVCSLAQISEEIFSLFAQNQKDPKKLAG